MTEIQSLETFPFELEVPYKLLETGPAGEKPLIIYLHGFNQNIKKFQYLMADLVDLEAYHLFIQGPYPIYDRRRKRRVEEWGRAWYLFDGNQEQFIHSMEKASTFIEQVLRKVQQEISVTRIALLGYSMGGYLGGYYALTRPQNLNELIVIGGRVKTEIITHPGELFQSLKFLALHGRSDRRVKIEPQKISCKRLAAWGAQVTFKEIEAGHDLSPKYVQEARKWLLSAGYR